MARIGLREVLRRWRRQEGADPDRRALRRVRWQLAALTVGLLCALLLAVGGAVYVTMQAALLTAVQTTLTSTAASATPRVLDRLHDHDDQYKSDPLQVQQRNGGVFVVFANRQLRVLGGGATPFGQSLFDTASARHVVSTRVGQFSTREASGHQRYLIYSEPTLRGDGQVAGVVQTGLSLRQYEDSLETLLHVLLIVGAVGVVAAAGISGLLVRRALQPIQHALRRQRDFVADAAHELRTPLTILRTAAELGLDHAEGDEATAALEQALVQGSHLTRLVDDLSLLARADSGVLTLARVPLDVTAVAADTVSSVEILAEECGVRLCLESQGVTRILGDAGRLRQLILILLDNALKHTQAGGTIAVGIERTGSHVRLHVRDTGPGIDPRDLPFLFERFYRANRARAGKGTGLGLAIARWIVEAHGGHISAANATDHGAIFSVTLPVNLHQ